MLYIYAYSNHKYGLSRVRRMAVLYKAMQEMGNSVKMLTNDFRAANIARDLGVDDCTTIETVQDIDSIAELGDTIVIDSAEDDRGRMKKFVDIFSKVYKITDDPNEISRYKEQMIPLCALVDDLYVSSLGEAKAERSIYFYGDSDADKYLEKNSDLFRSLGCELLLGEYFYLGYEDSLKQIFPKVHETEEYADMISTSRVVVSSSVQTAIEAYISGANSIYLDCHDIDEYNKATMQNLGIVIVNIHDKGSIKKALTDSKQRQNISYLDVKNIANMIQNTLK